MSSVSEIIVREYFELHEFLIRQDRKYIAQSRREEGEVDFFVFNPKAEKRGERTLPFVFGSGDLRFVERAIVVVKGWHTETFSQAVISHAPEIFRFLEPKVLQQITRSFGTDAKPLKLLVVPALPLDQEARDQSILSMRAKGVDAVIPFSTMLADLVANVEVNRNYQKSDLLQVIRIFKNYDFFKDPQMELFKSRRKKR